jgi:hypothetical protein
MCEDKSPSLDQLALPRYIIKNPWRLPCKILIQIYNNTYEL